MRSSASIHPTFPKAGCNVAYTLSALPSHMTQDIELDALSITSSPDLSEQKERSKLNDTRSHLYVPDTLWTRSFAIAVIIKAFLTVGMESWILIDISNNLRGIEQQDATRPLRSFLGLYIFALLYEFALSYDALRHKNTSQLVGVCIFNTGLLAYGFLQMKEINDIIVSFAHNDAFSKKSWALNYIGLWLVPVFLTVGTAVMIFLTWKLHAEFSWSIYKNISADLQMKRRYFAYQVYIALLKFDFFFIIGSQLQILLIVVKIESVEFIANAFMIPITILTLVLAAQFCRREEAKFLLIIMVFMLGMMACFVITLVRMHSPNHGGDSRAVQSFLTLFAVMSLLLITLTLINSLLCILNFNKGLKDHIEAFKTKRSASVTLRPGTRESDTRFLLN